MTYLKAQKTKISLGKQPVFLRGVNLGGWLMMEGYILHSLNIAEHIFKKNFLKCLGAKALRELEDAFRKNFIQKADFKRIADFGFNCLRVPFNHRLIEKQPFQYESQGLKFLDQVIDWAEEYRLWLILDLHAACGCQNHDWHSDSNGKADLWKNKVCQDRTVALWEFLANRYRDKKIIAGYDLLNEPVLENTKVLNTFLKRVINRIRSVDKNHIIFVEGNRWAIDIECLDDFSDDNLSLSIHSYEPIEFTFNYIPQLRYPLKSPQGDFNKATISRHLSRYAMIAQRFNRPIFVGEFGVNSREGLYGEDQWLSDALSVFKKLGFHWTYWTYKAVKNSLFPDGILSYFANPLWVRRQGALMGWDNYSQLWPKHKFDIIRSWKTENYQINKSILTTLQKFL